MNQKTHTLPNKYAVSKRKRIQNLRKNQRTVVMMSGQVVPGDIWPHQTPCPQYFLQPLTFMCHAGSFDVIFLRISLICMDCTSLIDKGITPKTSGNSCLSQQNVAFHGAGVGGRGSSDSCGASRSMSGRSGLDNATREPISSKSIERQSSSWTTSPNI